MPVSQLPTTTDATPDDSMLGRLDFDNDALVLNVAAITRLGNPFFVDAVASTLLAVAVAEATRGRKTKNKSQENFEPPPPSLTLPDSKQDKSSPWTTSFLAGFRGFGAKKPTRPAASGKGRKKSLAFSIRRPSRRSKAGSGVDKDIELGEWYGQNKTHSIVSDSNTNNTAAAAAAAAVTPKAQKQDLEKEKLPLVARSVIGVLSLMFRTILWVLEIAFKVVAGFFVMITRNASKL